MKNDGLETLRSHVARGARQKTASRGDLAAGGPRRVYDREAGKRRVHHFVNPTNPDEPESEWQVQTNFELQHPTEGDLVLDILEGNRVGGVEFLARLTGDA